MKACASKTFSPIKKRIVFNLCLSLFHIFTTAEGKVVDRNHNIVGEVDLEFRGGERKDLATQYVAKTARRSDA